jgi:catecholate siderophore receptor
LAGRRNPKQQKTAPSSWPVAYRWAAMGTLVMYTAVGTKIIPAARAQDGRAAPGHVPAAGLLTVRRFEIPAGLLEAAARAYQEVTGVAVNAAEEGILRVASPGVSGLYTNEEAIRRLLAGTGVSYRFTAAKTVLLELRGPDATVEVIERAAPLASPKYTEPILDTPQTIMVIPKSVIEEQGATTLRDVLRNVPGLTVAAGEGGVPAGDNLTLRGFSARNDLFVDGVRDLGVQSRDPFNMEQVEVTKGPTSAVTGRGSTGGVINMVSKAPFPGRFLGASANLGTDATRRFTADLNTPLRGLGMGERTALRLNLLSHESGVAGRDVVENSRWGFAPSLTFGLGAPTRITLSYFKLKQDNISDYGIPWVPATNNALAEYRDKPAPVPRETFYGLRSRDFERTGADTATARFERDFSDGVRLRSQLRFGRSTRDSMATPPRFAGDDSTVLNRNMRSWIAEDEIWDNQTDLTARFTTGPIGHALVAGAAFSRESNIRRVRTAPASPTTLFHPNPDDPYTEAITVSPFTGDIAGNTQALYAFDTLKLGSHWEATGGLRWERFDVRGVTTAPAAIARDDRMTSARAALVYKPAQRGSIYASYGTSLNPSLEGLSYAAASDAIPPEKTYTFEIGSKWDVAGERLMLSGAAFRVDKTNARTPRILPDDPPQVLDGRQRANGFELAATGAVTRDWRVFGAYTFIDGKIVRSNNPAETGKYFQNTPKNSFSVWTTYQLKRLTIGGGPRFLGRRYGNNTNTRFVDSYWTLDAMVSFPVSRNLDLRVNAYNLNNAYYFDRLGGGHLIPGAARSVNVTTAFRF